MRPVVSIFSLKGETGDTTLILDEWKRWQTSQALSERTIHDRRDVMLHLHHYSGQTPLLEITPAHIIDYCARPHLSSTSKASYHATIRAFFKWAVKTGRLESNPADETPVPKRPKGAPRPVQTAHISALIRAANRKRTHAMIILAVYAGLRVHEVAKFRGEDIDRIGRSITVTGKGGKTALLPAHDVIMELAETMPRRGYWFPAYATQTGAPHIGAKAVSRAIRDTMRRAGFDGKPHQLRHYYATELLDQGVDVRIVKDLMRHESLATTEIYTKVSLKRMREGIDRLPLAA